MKRRTVLGAATALWGWQLAHAQAYPTKPIRYIVPVAAGGGNDMIARVVTERWGRLIGQQFVVENQSGGGGVIACQTTARSAPDGYTLMQGYVATHGTTPATRNVSYDAVKDFTPIGMIGGTPNVLVVNSALPVKTLAEFIDYVRKNPGRVELRFGRTGIADSPDDGAVQAGDRCVHAAHPVPRHRAGLHRLARRADAGDVPRPRRSASAPPIGAGPALAVTGRSRSDQLKDVPTLEESGFKGFDAMQWYGSVGPAGMPADVVKRLNETQVAVLKDPELRERLAVEAVEPMPMSPEQFGKYIREDIQRWTVLAKARKIQLDG